MQHPIWQGIPDDQAIKTAVYQQAVTGYLISDINRTDE
jgi:hypothetical protein